MLSFVRYVASLHDVCSRLHSVRSSRGNRFGLSAYPAPNSEKCECFVVGAFPGALALGYLYGRAFADRRNELNGTVAVVGSFAVMLIGATTSGTAFVWLKVLGFGRR